MFSILIPSWNNLAYLRLCVESIRRHSAERHQVIVHVNDGSDGSLAWVREQGLASAGR
jgi:glycosyltransferase involved in cell wall biosynthesis